MKASRLICYAIVMIGFLASCQQQNIDTNNYNKGELVSVKLTANYIQTKVSYTETADMKFQPEWQLEDKVIGFDDSDNTYTFSVSEVGKYGTAILEGMAPANCTLHLIYLYGAQATSINGKSLSVSYDNQSGDKTMPAVMISDGEVEYGAGTFYFSNAGAVIGINAVNGVPEGSTISKITVFGENLSAATIALEDNALKLTAEEKADDSISTIDGFSKTVLDANGRLSSEPHKPILIAVPANAVIKGINYSIEGSDDYVFTLSTPETLAANQYCYVNSSDNIKYAVSLNTKSVAVNKSVEMHALLDATRSHSIPMVTEVTECISNPASFALTKVPLVNTTVNDYKALETLADIVDTFNAKAYDVSGTEIASQTVTWDESNIEWIGSPVTKWPQGASLSFLAYANLPSGQTASIASTGVSTSHTVPASADAQKDFFFGHYSGSGNNTGTAGIRFERPLTTVRLLRGDVNRELVIKSISIDGVTSGGTATMDPDGEISWNDVGTYDYSVSQEGDATTGLELSDLDGYTAKLIGEPFIIIPQKLTDHNVDITVTFTDGTEVVATLTSDEWKSGYINTYTLVYSTHTFEYTFELAESSDETQCFVNPTLTDMKEIQLVNKKTDELGAEYDTEWVIKSVQVGSETPETVNSNRILNKGGLDLYVSSGNRFVIASRKRSELLNSNEFWRNTSGRKDYLEWSPADWSSKGVIDLSKMDYSKDDFSSSVNAHEMTTANCYVIRHAGTYKLPLVYGNAVVDGIENTQSYSPTIAPGGSNALTPFVDHLGEGITSAFIENNANCNTISAAIIWQDNAEVIKNLSIEGTISENYSTSNVRYLQFTIDNNTVCQNNALICIYNDSNSNDQYDPGEAVWSWHIWTTNDPALLTSPISVTNADNVEYGFFPLNNLGFIDPSFYPARPDVKVVLSQIESGKELEIKIIQPLVNGDSFHSCYYQYGRKDPFFTQYNPTYTTVDRVTIQNAISDPGTQFTTHELRPNWYPTTYFNLWTGKKSTVGHINNDSDMIKTIYDPSPAGYKVPAPRAFSGFKLVSGDAEEYSEINAIGRINNQGYYLYTKPNKQGDIIFLPTYKGGDYVALYRTCGQIADYYTIVTGIVVRQNHDQFHADSYFGPLQMPILVRPVKE